MAGLWLDDAKYAELLRELTRVLQPRLANPPRPGRKRRILGYALLPGRDAASRPGDGAVSHPDDEPSASHGSAARAWASCRWRSALPGAAPRPGHHHDCCSTARFHTNRASSQ
jgi:hypothetical protein